MSRVHPLRRHTPLAAAALVLCLVAAACGGADEDVYGPLTSDLAFSVTDAAGLPVVGATVYLVPAADVDVAPITGSDVRSGASEDRDEPLEDAVRLRGATYRHAVTDAAGRAFLSAVAEGRYYRVVFPAAGDREHLPGGSGCRLATESPGLQAVAGDVMLSSKPGAAATHVGSSACLRCHAGHAGVATHAHSVGFTVPGQLAPRQDLTRYPFFRNGWDLFLSAASHGGGTPVWFSDYDVTRGADKFKTSRSDPTPRGETVHVLAWLWRDTADDGFKVTLENVGDPSDPRSPWTLDVALTYGGALYKQQSLVRVPGRKGLYPFFAYQTGGDETKYDRTRKEFRDHHLDRFWNAASGRLQDPPATATFDGNCAACHVTGLRRFQDATTSEWLSDAVDDAAGAFDLDGNGTLDEVNVGCEACHGPGSEHASWASSPASAGQEARFIVSPQLLSPSRDMMICGRCHDRPQGGGPVANGEPLDAQGRWPRAGLSRREFLAAHVRVKGPGPEDLWSDGLHSRSQHQQYADLLKSPKHRNSRMLVTCRDCHGSHGDTPFEHHLLDDPSDFESDLCRRCHLIDAPNHSARHTGFTHTATGAVCTRCHVYKTARSGAGGYGLLLGSPTGTASDTDIAYFEGDLGTHLFGHFARKTHPDVAGHKPGNAMAVPYTNSCARGCH